MEQFNSMHEVDPMIYKIDINYVPVKAEVQKLTDKPEIEARARDARGALVPVDGHEVHGTCMDERPRETAEVRPSAPGGPNVYGQAIAELTGQFNDADMTGEERLHDVSLKLKEAGLQCGGHEGCAACEKFGTWMPFVVDLSDDVSRYVSHKLGDTYDADVMQEIIDNAAELKESGRYADWNEGKLADELKDEPHGTIEKLQPVDHLGVLFVWDEVEGMTVDQNKLDNSAFVLDVHYMKEIESIVTAGPDTKRQEKLAAHARYAIARALQHALPNKELYDVTLSK
jgi:hypothetical protein